jgi:hypothetical protein
MIEASATVEVPWGYVCGYPTNRGKFGGSLRERPQPSFFFTHHSSQRVCINLIIAWNVSFNFFSGVRKFVRSGDLYGGAHYSQSSSATLTPQGRAIVSASGRFGDGLTLPFTPCKRGYIPVVGGERMFACHLHDRFRRRRFGRERAAFRAGEVDLAVLWKRKEQGPRRVASSIQKASVVREPSGASPSSRGGETIAVVTGESKPSPVSDGTDAKPVHRK